MLKREVPSIKELRERASTTRNSWVYKLVDRLAYYPAKLLLYTSITPNQITVFWAAIQIISTLFLMRGDYFTTIIALLVFQSMFILDCTDGIVARYKQHFSLKGRYLDDMGHYIANSCLLIFFTIGVFKQYHSLVYVLFGFIAVLAYLLNKSLTLNPVLYPDQDAELVISSSRKSYIQKQNKLFLIIFNFLRLEHFLNLLFLGVVFGYPHVVLIIYSIFFFLELIRKISMQYWLLHKLDKLKLKKIIIKQ